MYIGLTLLIDDKEVKTLIDVNTIERFDFREDGENRLIYKERDSEDFEIYQVIKNTLEQVDKKLKTINQYV